MGEKAQPLHRQQAKAYLFDMLKELASIARGCDEERVAYILDVLVSSWKRSSAAPEMLLLLERGPGRRIRRDSNTER